MEERSEMKRKPGPHPGSAGAERISAAHRGSHDHDKRGGFAADPERARVAGTLGGMTVKERYGSEFYQRVGARGGQATRTKFGAEHFAAIGRIGGSRPKRKRAP
jgi:general stress protein YciG